MTQNASSLSNEDKAKAVYAQAVDCIKKQDFAGADKYLTESMSIFPTADAAHNLGTLRYMQGKIDKAVELFHSAIQLNPHYDASYANLMRIMHQKKEYAKAIEYAALAMTAAPENKQYKQEFITILNLLKFEASNPDVKRLVLFCLEDGTLNYDFMGTAWLSLMVSDPELAPIYNLKKHRDFKTFEKAFLNLPNYGGLQSRYFTLGLQNILVTDLSFELLLTHLRRLILKDLVQEKSVLFGKDSIELTAGLSIYCFYTEYLFDVSDEEKKWLETLRATVEKQKNIVQNPFPLSVLACYEKIYTLPDAVSIAKELSDNETLKTFRKVHLAEPLEEQEIKKTIQTLTQMQTETSKEVQAQYEETPYPRWRFLPIPYGPKEFAPVQQFLPKGKARILIAGTGTGQEAFFYNRSFPDCDILAVDLSRASLSYGTRKLRETGYSNIIYKQADILALGQVLEPQSYDLIISSGVLHHMKVPEDGLASITRLLKPGGVMHLAFYSKYGRRVIIKAREIITKHNIKNDIESIKSFRRNSEKYFSSSEISNLLKFRDYYFLSEYRDLIFHVMEHCYDLLQIEALLNKEKLEFLGFHFPDDTIFESYSKMFPQDTKKTNLQNWDKFEKTNPDAFYRMYQFWVRKKP